MSLGDHEIDPPDTCQLHGRLLPCWDCRIEWGDVYADEQVQDEQDRKGKRHDR